MTQISIMGPGGPGLRGLAERIIRSIDSSFLISVETSGTPAPEDADYAAVLDEVNVGKSDNSYGNIKVYVDHYPWGG